MGFFDFFKKNKDNKKKTTNSEIKLDSREGFYTKIKDYYSEFIGIDDKIPEEFQIRIYNFLAKDFHSQYARFRIQYPKSIKRYSTLKLQDLENPLTKDLIISFVKKNRPNEYKIICSTLFKMSELEFNEYEKQRNDFRDMF